MKGASLYIIITLSLTLSVACKSGQDGDQDRRVTADNFLRLSDAQIQLANIKTEKVRESTIGRELSLTGVLKINEQSVATVSSRMSGRIEKMYFKNTGETVNKGDKLYEIYSDDLINSQREYFTLQSNNWNYSGKYQPSLVLEDKLMAIGMTPAQIKQLGIDGKVRFNLEIFSPVSGKIRSVNVSEGQYVESGQTLFELADDKELWLEAQVYPDEIRYLKTGMPAEAILPVEADLPVKCKLSFINPAFEKGRNVTLVRAVINNINGRLHPGMLAILNIQTQQRQGIVIPSSAVIDDGSSEQVWVRNTTGEFAPRMISTGLHSGNYVQVTSGLDTSDMVVTSGTYLLNSEMIMKYGSNAFNGIDHKDKRNEGSETITAGN